ncbi:Bug family tripartite tricarboxylate transporter substrate binding protein [Roseomonas chloroacetimidivorans]|uniref:Bug family tripartite tricarboxylate transporter substrate binding protein n=1 Tax=Roseomonas chloroacetimidivorans TaxID=1766656 RepID=UPI003C777BE0
MNVSRRILHSAAIAAPSLARAAGFPERPVTLICPTPPGGSTDATLRALAGAATRRLGQPVVVENRPGASQTLGPMAVARGRRDGYLLSQLPVTAIRVQLMQKLAFDPLNDLAPVVHVAAYTLGAAAKAGRFPKGWVDFVAEARGRPGQLSVGNTGVGTNTHLCMAELARREGLEVNHIPFRGESDGLQALLGGHVDAMAGTSGMGGPVDDKLLAWLHLWTPRRLPHWPDAPTLGELGYTAMDVFTSPYGIVAQAGTDPGILRALSAAFLEAARDPAHLAALQRYDMLPDVRDAAGYGAMLQQRVAQEQDLVRRLEQGHG